MAITSETVQDGDRLAVIYATNDGATDESGSSKAKKVDVSALSPAPTTVKILKCDYAVAGGNVNVIYNGSTDAHALVLPDGMTDQLDFSSFGGLPNKAGTPDGDIYLQGSDSTTTYTVVLTVLKVF